jgi:hypothetical protein
MFWFGLLGAAALLLTSSTQPGELLRQPTEHWVVNFDNSQCVASRNYGTAEEPLVLALKASPLGDVMQLAFLQKGNGGEAWEYEAKLTVDAQPVLKESVLVYKAKKASLKISRINLRAWVIP